MTFKTVPATDAARLFETEIDYEWSPDVGNTFLAADEHYDPELSAAIRRLNIHGAAEWCMARLHKDMPSMDGKRRLQSA